MSLGSTVKKMVACGANELDCGGGGLYLHLVCSSVLVGCGR